MKKELDTYECIFKALANRRRLMVVLCLKEKKQATAGEIAAHLKLSFRSTSRHLRTLASAEVIIARQKGLYRHYRLNPNAPSFIRALISMLSFVRTRE